VILVVNFNIFNRIIWTLCESTLKINSIKSRISNIASIKSVQIIGAHELYFSGLDEQIVIKHNVFSRKVFASCALKASMFLHECNNPRLYSMKDIFHNSQ
jgi:dihydrodipicolinate reductase